MTHSASTAAAAETGPSDAAVPDTVLHLPAFDDPGLFAWLMQASAAALDGLPFGLIAMSLDGKVEHYNTSEGRYAGLSASRVVGRNFFTTVGPCTNNAMVAERFMREPDLDASIDYVFTFRMAPQKVRLRMMRKPGVARMFLAVVRRT